MIAPSIQKIILLTALIYLCTGTAVAQRCINRFTSINLQAESYDSFTCTSVTSSNEILVAGGLYDYNKAAHIAKFSAQGSPIWSYQYSLDFYDFIKAIFFKTINFSDMVSTADGGLLVVGNVDQVLSPWGNPPPVKKWGLMAKIDRFGTVAWTKTVTGQGELSFTNICATDDGDFIAYLATDNGQKNAPGDHSYGKLVRIGANGEIRWSTFLFTYLFDAGGLGLANKRALLQASNRNIILADVVHKTTPFGITREGNLHFLELDYNTGAVNWETSYEYPAPGQDPNYLPDMLNVKELPNGKFSFISSLYLPVGDPFNLVKKAVNIITSNRGVIEKLIIYSPAGGSSCRVKDVAADPATGNRTLLIDHSSKTALLNIADNGVIEWQRGIDDGQGNFPVNCFSSGEGQYQVFRSNNRSHTYNLLLTDEQGRIDCANEPTDFTAREEALNYSHDSVVTDLNYHFDEYYDYAYPLKRNEAYLLAKTIVCQDTEACCKDVIDTVNIQQVHICEGTDYHLPDNSIVKDAGLYYVTFKTPLGCDSIRYYRVEVDKNVASLSLGNDTCLTANSVITLKATSGFENYYWMNSLLPAQDTFLVAQPGRYFTRVSNVCGSKTDSIEIFDQCDYPLYMPTGFSPNGDGINDIFRIDPRNKNRLLNFRIYNRWGKLIFQTSDPARGWDGSFNNEPLPTDTFIYIVQMLGLSGKPVLAKGYITLVR